MTCIKKFLYSVAFVFLLSVFTVFGISPNTNAIEDLSGSFSKSGSTQYLCNSSGSYSPCGDRTYLKIEFSDPSIILPSDYFYFIVDLQIGSNSLQRPSYSLNSYLYSYVFHFDSAPSRISFLFNNVPSTGTFNVILSDSPFTSSGGIIPEGSIEITENGTFDVTNFAEAVVDVPIIYGDYHDDLVSINNSIIICAGVVLVIYFFYAIYRMMFKGVKS